MVNYNTILNAAIQWLTERPLNWPERPVKWWSGSKMYAYHVNCEIYMKWIWKIYLQQSYGLELKYVKLLSIESNYKGFIFYFLWKWFSLFSGQISCGWNGIYVFGHLHWEKHFSVKYFRFDMWHPTCNRAPLYTLEKRFATPWMFTIFFA